MVSYEEAFSYAWDMAVQFGWEECTVFDEMETDGDRVKDVVTCFAG